MSTVLVTGGSGFVGSHVILQLLSAGHKVRTTVRSLRRESELRAELMEGGAEPESALSFVVADLENDAGWADGVGGCEYVFHVASPFPAGTPSHEDELIVPARDGTLRVLRAARQADVRRVIMTSSFGAIGYGHPSQTAPFDETTWTNVNANGISAYIKSKTLAERAAWDFIADDGAGLELTVVNPVGVFGPVLGSKLSASTQIIKLMMDGSMARCPKIHFGVVDVRDVAELHLLAMVHPDAAGERFLAVSGDCMSMLDVASVLTRRMVDAAKNVPTAEVPNWLLRIISLWNSEVRSILPDLSKIRNSSNAKARHVLGWAPRSNEQAILATAESLLRLGLLKDSSKKAV